MRNEWMNEWIDSARNSQAIYSASLVFQFRCVYFAACVCLRPRDGNKNPGSSVACRGYVVRRRAPYIMHWESNVNLILLTETAHSLLVAQHKERCEIVIVTHTNIVRYVIWRCWIVCVHEWAFQVRYVANVRIITLQQLFSILGEQFAWHTLCEYVTGVLITRDMCNT